ncbi:UDP-N-acetylglucosamine UDP-glucose GDP-mannose transporter [Micractinium conductrix]|uniref:UDP-N-acetylglucosamine UDP-glucose GDP-mannose transporter n=1 Tax=Micractinium conductrix TaxID=554055 RepID=A0A2P6VI93_9CHLO|nr:UDP-N-acetylglucosamine UDP-glucose GDP-mannose transporter [Micractinium conductrix]|eukprot:PSC73804.1 UDP-N-acetylglucosamine UDP-glucose GDP-mannose transporter [Micractinium conductrix]
MGEGSAPAAEPTPLLRLGAVLYFMGSSMLVQFTTKAVFTNFGFHFPLTVALLQMAFIAPVSYVVARPVLSWALVRQLAPLAMVNVLNVVCGLIGTAGLNVPMFIALRRFTLLFTILLERFWLKKSHDWPTLSAVGVMISGALIAAATDLSFNPRGYAAVLCNDLLTSLYLIMVKNTPGTNGLSTTGMLFYNSVLSLPMLLAATVAKGEPSRMTSFPLLWDTNFQMVLFLASALGLTINHSTFVCTRINEPLMTSTAGNLKNAAMTIVGAFAFGDFIFEPLNAMGLAISMGGAVWYALRSALRARQKSIKDRLLQQVPVIGRDRLHRGGAQPQLTGAPLGFTASGASSALLDGGGMGKSRSESRGDLFERPLQ